MNGDGKTDLVLGYRSVVMSSQKAHVAVLLGNGDATFKTDMAFTDVTIDSIQTGPITALGVADFTDDDKPDVAVIGAADSRVVTYRGTGGAPFLNKERDTSFPIPVALALDDLAGSAKKDLAVVGQGDPRSQNNLYFLIDGNSEFARRVDRTSFATVAILDSDGDKVNDVVLGTSDTGEIAVRRGNGRPDALQGIGSRTDLTFSTVGAGPLPLGAGDWTFDGKQDLLLLNTEGSTIGVAQGSGNGFAPARTWPVSPGTDCAQYVDVNGDGRRDVVSCNPVAGTFSVLLQSWR